VKNQCDFVCDLRAAGLDCPKCLAFDFAGNLYVGCCGWNGGVQKFERNEAVGFTPSWSLPIKKVMGIAVAPNGNLYLSRKDNETHEICVYSAQGELLKTWGSIGAEEGQFSTPAGVAVDSAGCVYVVEASSWPFVARGNETVPGGMRVQKFDADGNFIRAWGAYGFGEGFFNVPVGIAVDRDNRVLVADTHNSRVQAFDCDGVFLRAWGTHGETDGQMNCPQGIAVHPCGDVFVADTLNNRVQRFSPSGEWLATMGGAGDFWLPCGIAFDRGGVMAVADTMNQRIRIGHSFLDHRMARMETN